MPLGLHTSNSQASYWSRNIRRRVAYDFPQGTAPLTALLSLFEPEDTPLPEFGWQEERYAPVRTMTASSGQPTADIVFYNQGTTTSAGTPITITAGLQLRAYVDDASEFQVDDTICFFNLTLTSGTGNLTGRVIGANSTDNWIEFECTAAPQSTVVNSAVAEDKYVVLIGSAYAEGSRSRKGRIKYPIEVQNYCQMHKNTFALTSYALKAPLVYNKSGDYEKALKSNGIDHLSGLESTTIWERRRSTTAVDPDSGETVRRYFTGGLLWFLEQWELGNVSNGGAFNYRPGEASVRTQTDWETYTAKRIIQLGGSTISRRQFNTLIGRTFEKTNNTSWSKLVLCGQGFLNSVSDHFESQVTWTSLRENTHKGWDFELLEHRSNAGTVYYKTHPMFNDTSGLFLNSALIVDLGWLKWRPLTDHDTDVKEGIQANDALVRKDQYLTVGGLEIWYPEAHMWIDNLGAIIK